jgi:hypothetical protein
MPIAFTDSASRHGISREDAIHAMLNAVEIQPATGRYGDNALHFLGPAHRQTNRLIEVVASQQGPNITIFHAMDTGRRA